MEYRFVPRSEPQRSSLRWAAGIVAIAMALIGALMLLLPTNATAASEPSGVEAAEAAPVVAEPEAESAPVEPSAVASEEVPAEAEAPVPEEASAPESATETPVAEAGVEEAAATAAPTPETQPQPEPQSELAPAEATSAEVTGLVEETEERVASATGGDVPVPQVTDAVGKPADLGAGIEKTVATVVDSLGGPTPLETLMPDRSSGFEGLLAADGWAEPTAGSTASTPVLEELLPGPLAQPPEPRLPTAIDPPRASAPGGVAVPASESFAHQGARGMSQASPTAFAPSLPLLRSAGDEARSGAARAASAGQPAVPLSPDRPPSSRLDIGSGTGGSIFVPLLGVLALLALAAPRGYRRRNVVRDFPVPTPFVCALERPG